MDVETNEPAKSTELTGRQRKKLYHKLKEQMEFYFSDSNLAKDKFLYNLIQQNSDGYVDIEVFKTFNKIKTLSEDSNLIVASLSRSNILEVSEDKSKVRRISEIDLSKDFDACTLYIEGLPSHANYKWVKDIFENFGTVDYINIPQYKNSRKIKGFAFIEYSCPESVIKACQFYENSAKAENDSTSEEETIEIKEGKVRKAEDSGTRKTKKLKLDKNNETGKEPAQSRNSDLEKQQTSPMKIKRKLEDSFSDDTESCKKTKTHSNHQEAEKSSHLSDGGNNLNEESTENNASEIENNCTNEEAKENSSKSKKKRKHSRKNRVRHERPSLRVMSKAQWKNYRNRYLELQRSTMSFLKKQVLLESEEMRIHDYSSTKHDQSQKKELKFLPGVIIKIHLPKIVENLSDVREQIKSSTVVAYIEASSGSDIVFIRCHTSEDANLIIQEGKLNHIGTTELLTGSSEEEYWKKIMSDREAKLNMPRKRRGRDKLIAKAAKLVEHRNKHIYYD